MYLTGEELRSRRTELGISLDDLSKAAGVSKGYISKFENGNVESVSDKTMTKLCIALGYTVASTDDNASNEVKIARLRADMKSGELSVDERLEYAESIKLDEHDRDPRTAGDLYLIMAQLYREKREYAKAVRCCLEAEEVFAKNGEVYSWCRVVYEHGLIEHNRHEFKIAIEQFKAVERRVRDLPTHSNFLLKVIVKLAMCFASIRDKGETEYYLSKIDALIEYAEPSERLYIRGKQQHLTGLILFEKKAFQDAITFFKSAEVLFSEGNHHSDIQDTRYNIALAMKNYNAQGALEIARSVLEEQYTVAAQRNVIARTSTLVARILYELREFDELERICTPMSNDLDIDIRYRSYANYYIAEVLLARSDHEGFNRRINAVVSSLYEAGRSEYAVRFVNRYMEVTHNFKS